MFLVVWTVAFFTFFFSSSFRVSKNVPLLCQFAVYFQYDIGLYLQTFPSKRSSISAFMYTLRPTEDTVQENCFYCFAQVDLILFSGVRSWPSSTLAGIHHARLIVSISIFTILSAFNLSVCPSVRQHGTTRLPLHEFS